MEQISPDTCCRNPSQSGEPDARILELAVALDEIFVMIDGKTHYLWRAVDREGEVLESYVTKRRDRKAALKFIRKSMKPDGNPKVIVTDKLRSYGAAMKVIGNFFQARNGPLVE